MITIESFVMNNKNSDERYLCYNLNKNMQIFNYEINVDDFSDIELYISSTISLESIFDDITTYFLWFTKCESVVKSYYEEESQAKVNDNWFDDIEVYEICITYNDKNDFGATVCCGDQILIDHILEIEFDRYEVADIRLNG